MTRLEEARHQLLEREQAARASAEEANRLKDQFLAIVSHELRTPLNVDPRLGRHAAPAASWQRTRRERACEAIFDSAQRQAQLIDDLLDVARIMSGKLRLERTFVDARGRASRRAAGRAADRRRQAGIRIGFDADPAIGTIYGDAARLQQVVWNLLSNAVSSRRTAAPSTCSCGAAGDSVEMIVTDTGQGIAPDFLPSVFEPFRQADGSTTRRTAASASACRSSSTSSRRTAAR